jgi:enoyl-CoA hydratase/carnithine racemase
MADSNDSVVTERQGNVLVVRINRPEARNAMNRRVMAGLGLAVQEAEAETAIRALVLTGTGDKAFCSGRDLRELASGDQVPVDTGLLEALSRLLHGHLAVPVVGAANASALAGGFELLLGCDVIVASSEAKFGLPEVKRGLFAAGNGTQLAMRVPLAVALELALTGDSIDAPRAYALGLVNQVVPPDQVVEAAVVLAERIAVNGPLAVAATKELVRTWQVDFDRADRRRAELQQSIFASDDAREGARAFVEKRAPVFHGR